MASSSTNFVAAAKALAPEIRAAADMLAPENYQMAGQAFLGGDMRATPLLRGDNRSAD